VEGKVGESAKAVVLYDSDDKDFNGNEDMFKSAARKANAEEWKMQA